MAQNLFGAMLRFVVPQLSKLASSDTVKLETATAAIFSRLKWPCARTQSLSERRRRACE
jgi:hypothetical protein